jgi:hypothetical protein
MDSRPDRKRIVILGGGFGGSYLAKELAKRRYGLDVEVVIIDRNNYFIFYPLLIEAGCGSIEPRHCTVPIREFANKAELLMAEVSGLDIEQQRVHFQLIGDDHCRSIEYDHLVVALGSVTRIMPEDVVSGVREHAFFMKHMSDAVIIRDRAVELLELANAIDDPEERRRLLHFVIVGGNVTGIEVVGELEVFVREASAYYRNVSDDDITFSVFEFNTRLLAILPENLSNWATKHLAKRGINIHTGTGVKEVHADHVVDSNGNVISCSTVIWTALLQARCSNSLMVFRSISLADCSAKATIRSLAPTIFGEWAIVLRLKGTMGSPCHRLLRSPFARRRRWPPILRRSKRGVQRSQAELNYRAYWSRLVDTAAWLQSKASEFTGSLRGRCGERFTCSRRRGLAAA